MNRNKIAIIFILFFASFCSGADTIINAFNSGEMSPLLEGRTDIEKYYSGCRTLENFLVMSYGGITRRPGTYYIASAKNSDEACRLIPFEYSSEQAYIIEIGDEYMRFYKDGGQILDANSNTYEISTPYDTDNGTDLFEMQYIQSADVMYIVHPNYAPRKLTRTAHASWTLTEIDFERGPFLNENTTSTTITPVGYKIDDVNTTNEVFTIGGDGNLASYFSAGENFLVGDSTGNDDVWTVSSVAYSDPNFDITVTGDVTDSTADGNIIVVDGAVTLTASAATFNSNHIGALWQITHTIAGDSASGSFTADGNSSSVAVYLNQKYDFSTHGTWKGTVKLQRSYDGGTIWKDVKPVHYENDGNITYSEEETVDDALYRLRMESYSSGTCNYNLTSRSHDLDGVVEITAVASTTSATATVESMIGDTSATKYWSEGAWSPDEGYPSCVAFYENKIVYAGNKNSPQTMWFSVSDDWDNFLAGTDDDSAMEYTLAADKVNVIRWLAPQDWLLVGTMGGEWKIGSGSSEEPLTPTAVVCKKQSNYGSANIQSVMINNVILFIQRQARKIRELVYSFEQDSWVAPDMTILSEHITDSGIKQVALQKTPDPILWCVRNDGNMPTMTYQREQEVVGWSLQTTDGDFESVAVIPGDDEDEVWVSVKRNINNSDVRYIEQFQPRDWGTAQRDAFFVDCGLSYDGGAEVDITNIIKASPAVVTAVSHGFSDGNQVRISDVVGMTEVNKKVYSVGTIATNTFELRDKTDAVDINSNSFTTYVSGGVAETQENTFSTLSHLQNESVVVVGDGGYVGTETVKSSKVILDDYYNTVHIGLNYTSKLKPMRLEIPGRNIQGKTLRTTEVMVRFYKSLGCDVGSSWSDYDSFVFRDANSPLEAVTPLYTGDKTIKFDADYETSGDIFIQQQKPLPLTIMCIVPTFEVYK